MKKPFYVLFLFFLGLQSIAYAQHEAKTKIPADSGSAQLHKLQEINIIQKKRIKLRKDTLSGTLKLKQPLLETPQSIVSISSGLLRQQGALELKDIARNASGVYFGYNSTPLDNSTFIQMRGFSASRTTNGLSRRFFSGASIDDESLIESVEVIKGPAGFLNSNGEPGGAVNMNTKTPQHKLLNTEFSGGSFNLYRASVDVSSNLSSKGFSYRFNLAYQHKDSYLSDLRTERYVIAPVIQYNFTPNTYVLAEYNLIRGQVENGSALVKVRSEDDYLKGPISANYSAGNGLPASTAQNQSGRVVIAHKFNEGWEITSQSNYLSAPFSTWNMTSKGSMVNFDKNGNTKRRSSFTRGTGENFASQLFVNGRFNTIGVHHQLLFGGDYTNSKDSLSLNNGKVEFDYSRLTANNYVDAVLVKQTTRTALINNNTYLKSVFIYDNLSLFEQLKLTIGGRYTWYKNERINTTVNGPGAPQEYRQKAFSPRAALTFLLDTATTMYALYDQSFLPQSGQQAITDAANALVGSKPVDPQFGNNVELGIKRQWFKSRLLTTLTAFHTVKTNILVSDLTNPGFAKQIGEATSDGIEADILGNITDALAISANYTYVKAKISKDSNPDLIDKALPQTPQQIFNTWLQYSFLINKNGRLALSIGQVSNFKRSTSEKNKVIPDFTKFDAGINYTQDKYYLRFLVDNLTGKRYMASGDIISDYPYPGRDYYYIDGEPFNVRLTFGVKF